MPSSFGEEAGDRYRRFMMAMSMNYNVLPLTLCLTLYESLDFWVYPICPLDFVVFGGTFFALQFMQMIATRSPRR